MKAFRGRHSRVARVSGIHVRGNEICGQAHNRAVWVILLCLLLSAGPVSAAPVEFGLLTTITNPAPSFYPDQFGWSVACVGSEQVLVGAPYKDTTLNNVGAAYLYHTNGTLLVTLTNPAPLENDAFGWAVAAVGAEAVAVSAILGSTGSGRAGVVYLYDLGAKPLTTLTNPTPAADDYFGWSLAGFSNDRVIVGAYWDDTGATDSGAAYLFNTNGTLLTTITNPTPAYQDDFGYSVAALGADGVIVGARGDSRGAAHTGAAYLFNTNGVLLVTITNPTPVSFDYFGTAVAAVGGNRILIGAPSDNTGAEDAGAAYLFDRSGNHLTTITNPTPNYLDSFGYSVAAVGDSQVLIGAYRDDSGANDAGIAYLFDLNGKLLNTITKPAPQSYDSFGNAVSATPNLLAIGGFADNTGAPSAGAVFIYTPTAAPVSPILAIAMTSTNTVVIWWPSTSTGWVLQENSGGLNPANWNDITTGIVEDGANKKLVVQPSSDRRFYRLRKT